MAYDIEKAKNKIWKNGLSPWNPGVSTWMFPEVSVSKEILCTMSSRCA